MKQYKKINNFNNLIKTNKTLIICDIDETIMQFEDEYNLISNKWWNKKINEYMLEYNCDYNSASDMAYNDWYKFVSCNNPKFTDKEGFLKLLKELNQTNSDIIFLTARNNNICKLTHYHFTSLNIDSSNFKIHFTNMTEKGKYIKNNINTKKYNKIIFIDDTRRNLDSVFYEFNGFIDCLHFNLIN